MRLSRILLVIAALPVVTILLLAIATVRWKDPALFPANPPEAGVAVSVVSHGWHAGLVIPVASLAGHGPPGSGLAAIADRFSSFSHVEIGWGDETFYRFAPEISDLDIGMALAALSGTKEGTVLHVVGLDVSAREAFPGADVVDLSLSADGFARLLRVIDDTVAGRDGEAEELGSGLYGPSLFYRARGRYSLLRTCNRWVSDVLAAAGVPSSPVPSTLAIGLMAELRWRAVARH